MEYFNTYYPSNPPVDPLVGKQLDQKSVNQTWYSDRLRSENLDLARENNVMQQDNRYFAQKMQLVHSEQQKKIEGLWDENQQKSRMIAEIERNYNEELQNSDMNQQEIYRMRIQYDDMRNHLEKIVAEKDSIILDLRRRLAEALQDRDGHLDARVELEKQYRKGLHKSLNSRGEKPSIVDSEVFGDKVKISQLPDQEEKKEDEYDLLMKGTDVNQTVPRFQQDQDQFNPGETKMSYKNTIGLKRLETENQHLKDQLQNKHQEVIDLHKKISDLKIKHERQIEDEKRHERKRSQFNNTMQSMPFQAENEDLRKKKAESDGQVQKLRNENRKQQSKLRENIAEIEKLNRKIKAMESQQKMRQEQQKDQKNLQQEMTYQQQQQQQQEDLMKYDQKTDEAFKEDGPGQMVVKVSEDRNLLDGVIGLMHYVRESTVDMIFEVFVRSANQAHTRKTNSLIIFSINLKEMKEKNIRGFVITLFLHKKMKQLLKMYYPNYGKSSIDNYHVKLSMGKKQKIGENPSDYRDDVNQWLENSVKQAQFKRDHHEKDEMNRDLNYLFRLLSLKYRVKYPLSGQAYKLDLDLRVRLENKITSALLRCFIDE